MQKKFISFSILCLLSISIVGLRFLDDNNENIKDSSFIINTINNYIGTS